MLFFRAKFSRLLALSGILLALPMLSAHCQTRVVLKFSSGGELNPQERRNLDIFMQRNPDIEVRPVKLPALSMSQHDSYVTYLSSGEETVDVFAIDVIWLAEFAASGWIYPLDAFFSPEDRAVFLPALLQAGFYAEKLYGIPGNADTGMVYANLRLLRKFQYPLPETFDWKQIPKSAGAPTIPVAFQATQSESLICNLLEFFPQNVELNADWLTSLTEQKDLWRGALTLMRAAVLAARGQPLQMDEGLSAQAFLNDHALYLRNWPYVMGLLHRAGKKSGRDFAVVPMATRPTIGGWYLVVNANSPHKEKAARLVKFLTSEEVQLATLDNNYRNNEPLAFPSARRAYSDPEWQKKIPELRAIERNLANARARFISPDYYAQSRAVIPEIHAYLAGKQTLETALSRMQEKIAATGGKR